MNTPGVYLQLQSATKSHQMKAEDQLREYAQTLGVSMKALLTLVNQVFIDDENIRKRQNEQQRQMVERKQLMAMDLEMSVNAIDLEIKRGKLLRVKKRIERWNRIKSLFTFKKKVNEQPGTDPKGR